MHILDFYTKDNFTSERKSKLFYTLQYLCYLQIKTNFVLKNGFLSTVKPVNKGQISEKRYMVFIDKWHLFGGYMVLFNQGMVTEVWSLFTGWSLFGGGL